MESLGIQEIVWRPSKEMIANANMTVFMKALGISEYGELARRSVEEPEWFWDALIRHCGIRFYKPYDQVLDLSGGLPWAKWCVGGKSNAVLNCLDKHLDTPLAIQEALVWEAEDGTVRRWSYAELNAETCRFAAAMRGLAYGVGDVIALYLPFLPESVAAMLAVAKIGAIVLPLFSGYGTNAVMDRMNDAGAVGVLTVDGTMRRGKLVQLKPVVDEAAAAVASLRHVIVIKSAGPQVRMQPGRDHWWHELRESQPENSPTEQVDADAPMILAYTSGTTGKAKGTILTHIGMLTKIALDFGLCMDFKPGDRIMWLSDMGWVVGPLMSLCATSLQGTMVIAEGGPDYPQPGRMWKLVQEHKVSFLGVAPTTIRTAMRHGEQEIAKYDLSSLRIVTSTGEAWNPDSWLWCFDHVCKGKAPLHNYTGGTEISGGILSTTVIHPIKPCSFSGSIPGMGADVVDESGASLPPGKLGELVLRNASIGLTRGLWRDQTGRYLESYWNKIPGLWVHGDFAYRDEDGFWFVPGRSDDAFNVAGKRVGPSEAESLLLATGKLAEAAVVGVPDSIKGEALVCVCVPSAGTKADQSLDERLSRAIVDGLGKPFAPREFIYVSDLPKTRNMKVMRRVVRAIYSGAPTGDLAALLNPEAVTELKEVLANLRG
ncbi:MAG: AMP-binding protein [SAR324 cluster bacterium]|nr:AMP-binding protein [SAR324 cluster bacterium]